MSDKTEFLTKEKFEELSKELENLKTVRRKEVAEQLEYAKSLGDLSENAEYHEARELQANIEDRIGKLDLMLKTSTIMSEERTEKVGVGSTVVVSKVGENSEIRYKIVGTEEANLLQGKLSLNSPLGKVLMGKKKGETVNAQTPGGAVSYKILSVE